MSGARVLYGHFYSWLLEGRQQLLLWLPKSTWRGLLLHFKKKLLRFKWAKRSISKPVVFALSLCLHTAIKNYNTSTAGYNIIFNVIQMFRLFVFFRLKKKKTKKKPGQLGRKSCDFLPDSNAHRNKNLTANIWWSSSQVIVMTKHFVC